MEAEKKSLDFSLPKLSIISVDDDIHNLLQSDAIIGDKSLLVLKDRSDLYEIAQKLLENEIQCWNNDASNRKVVPGRNRRILGKLASSGTISDRVSSLEFFITDSPLHSIHQIADLVGMCTKKGRRECIPAIVCFKNLLINKLLPDRKLMNFQNVVAAHKNPKISIKRLIIAAYEHRLKVLYQKFVTVLETLLKDSLSEIRTKISGVVLDLLNAKPENEQKLLSLLVNKLGDQNRSVASHVIFLLLKLLNAHSRMTGIILEELRLFLLRPNMDSKSQHYALCVMNQIILSRKYPNLANSLIHIYFSFFEKNVNQEGVNQKILASLLRGINRAYPYANYDDKKTESHIEYLYKVVQMGCLTVTIQAMTLLFTYLTRMNLPMDKYYQILFSKIFSLLSAEGVNNFTSFLNLMDKSLMADSSILRIGGFMRRILQLIIHVDASIASSLLLFLSKLNENNKFYYLGRKSAKSTVHLSRALIEPDESEIFVDLPIESDETRSGISARQKSTKNFHGKTELTSKGHHSKPENHGYGSKDSQFWILPVLIRHHHLSIGKFSEHLQKDGKLNYNGDPFEDFSQMRFLDLILKKNLHNKPNESSKMDSQNRENKKSPNDDLVAFRMDLFEKKKQKGRVRKRNRCQTGENFDSSDEEPEFDLNDVDFLSEGRAFVQQKRQNESDKRRTKRMMNSKGDDDMDSEPSSDEDDNSDVNSGSDNEEDMISSSEDDDIENKSNVNSRKFNKRQRKPTTSSYFSQRFKRRRIGGGV